MADESNYTAEERIVISTRAREGAHTGKTISDMRNDFTVRFAPAKMKILHWEKKIFQQDFIKERP
jgi:hypothetical protein